MPGAGRPEPASVQELTCFDLGWKISGAVVDGPFCPGCGRLVAKRARAWGGTPWHTVENPCRVCGRRASHPELHHTIPALKRGVLVEAERRARSGGPAPPLRG